MENSRLPLFSPFLPSSPWSPPPWILYLPVLSWRKGNHQLPADGLPPLHVTFLPFPPRVYIVLPLFMVWISSLESKKLLFPLPEGSTLLPFSFFIFSIAGSITKKLNFSYLTHTGTFLELICHRSLFLVLLGPLPKG